jgi:opacity protein-like surface antigen
MNKWITTTALALGAMGIPAVASAEVQGRVFGGWANVTDFDSSYAGYAAEFAVDNGFVVGAGLGVAMGDFTVEGELAYRSADMDEVCVTYYGCYTLDGDVSSTSLMANVWYNFERTDKWGVYAGGGIGVSNTEFSYYGYSDDSTDFAWQLGIGANYQTDAGFTIGMGYRYFNVPEVGDSGVDVASNEVIFEIGRSF